jgi:hypothetical protein
VTIRRASSENQKVLEVTGESEQAAKPKALVVVLNQTRGAQVTIGPLLSTGLSQLDWTVAYCGAKPEAGPNPYAGVAEFLWEYDEPVSWLEELERILPSSLHGFFLDTKALNGISTSPEHVQLWISGWIQNVFRVRALYKISLLRLDKCFDWIFFVRSDYFFLSPIVLDDTSANGGLTFMVGDSYGGLNDRLTGIPSSLVPSVKRALDYSKAGFIGQNDQLFWFLRREYSRNPETLMWFQLKKVGLMDGASFVAQLGFCLRLEHDHSRWATGFWSRRRALYVKYPTELLLSKWCAAFLRGGSNSVLLNVFAKTARVAGTQPRLLLAPMLAAQGELGLGWQVFLRSKRESQSLIVQLMRDFWKMFRDIFLVLSGKRTWVAG